MSKAKGERYTIAVDFDGVLHSYTTPWQGATIIPDPPVPGAIEWLKSMLPHFDVVIHTTRGKTPEGRDAVLRWIHQWDPDNYWTLNEATGMGQKVALVPSLRVTDEKPAALIYLDDRGYRFEGPGTFPTKEQVHAARPWNKR